MTDKNRVYTKKIMKKARALKDKGLSWTTVAFVLFEDQTRASPLRSAMVKAGMHEPIVPFDAYGWITVDAPPKTDAYVLVNRRSPQGKQIYDFGFYGPGYNPPYEDMTHWMYLPGPPK